MTSTQLRGRLQAPQEAAYTVQPDGQGYRAEADGWSGRDLARRLLTEKLGVPCFGRMSYPQFFGRVAATGASEAEALANARTEEAQLRERVAAGVAQLARCAYCP